MVIPCDKHVNCECSELPLSNFSSEDPDRFVLLGHSFGYLNVPPINFDPGTEDCVAWSASSLSQDDADLCALYQQQECEYAFSMPSPCDVCGGAVGATGGSLASFLGYTRNPDAIGPDCCDPDAVEECCCASITTDPNEDNDDGGDGNGNGGGGDDGGGGGQPPVVPTLFSNDPQTCSVECPDGTDFTKSVPAGVYLASSKALANSMAYSAACAAARRERICEDNDYGGGDICNCKIICADTPVDLQIGASSASGSELSFEIVDGNLPAGLSMDSTGKITGDATSTTGSDTAKVKISDTNGNSKIIEYCISVFGITNTSLPNGGVGQSYSAQLTASGGCAPYTFGVDYGMPTGLNLDSETGVIDGTPDTAGGYTPLFQVYDSQGNMCPMELEIHIYDVINEEQTLTLECVGDPARNVTITIPAGTLGFPAGTSQTEANIAARNLALQQASAALAANGCGCYVDSFASTGDGHSGVLTGNGGGGCSISLIALQEDLVSGFAPNIITGITIDNLPAPGGCGAAFVRDLDCLFDTFGPGHATNWPSAVDYAYYVRAGMAPYTMDDVIFIYQHLAH